MCFWDRNDAGRQVQFIESMDPSYFAYLGRIHEAHLSGADSLHAAVALRVTYSHALETLFALIGAAVQAPACPAGWFLKYKNADLNNLIKNIHSHKSFYNKLGIERGGWPEVVEALTPWELPDQAQVELKAATVKFWESLTKEFLDQNFQDEYNSLKHGFRVRSGEWYLAIGREDVPGVPAPPERMQTMAHSQFGSTFLRPMSLKKHHWAFEEQRVNWNPAEFAKRLPFVVESINNIIAFLKCMNGVPLQNVQVAFISHEMVHEALSDSDHSTATKFSVRFCITPEMVPDVSAEDILLKYSQTPDLTGEHQEAAP